MPEMLKPTAAIMGAGLGVTHGFVGHITPEARSEVRLRWLKMET